MKTALSAWQKSLPELRAAMTPISFTTWIEPIASICIEDNTLVLQARDTTAKSTLKNIYRDIVTDCVNRCSLGARQCAPNGGFLTCEMTAAGCTDWGTDRLPS